MSTNTKQEKRRGRPPKNLIVAPVVKQKATVKVPQEEQLVLYLPSFDDDEDINNNDSNDTETVKDRDSDSDRNNYQSDSETDEHFSLKHLTDHNDSDTKQVHHTKKNISIDKLIEELHKRDALINTLKSQVKHKSLFNENTLTLTKENKKNLINIGLITINKNKINICEKTNLACWWCTYQFDTQPLFMPDHYKNNIYYVFGNYCSFACMMAYNEDMDDYRKSVRMALIKQLYCEIFQCNQMNIKAAGPREILDKFGGIMTINKFRDNHTVSTKVIKISLPPMIPLISDYEEVIIEKK